MKKISQSLLAILVCVLVIVPITLTGCEKETSYPKNEVAMWAVTSDDSDATLYLMGSIHVAKDDTFPLRKEITNAFEESDYLAVEVNMNEYIKDPTAMYETQQKCLCKDETDITDHLSDSTYQNAKLLLSENNMYAEIYDMFGPFMWSSLIDNALILNTDFSAENGVDTTLIDMADEKGKEVLEVESMDFQVDMSIGFPDEIYDIIISGTVDSADDYEEGIEELYNAWHKGDTTKLVNIINEEDEDLTEDQQKLYDDYNKAMLTDRNIGMADTAEQYLAEDKDVFFVVGVAHMVGDDGIVQLLKDRGYTVTRV